MAKTIYLNTPRIEERYEAAEVADAALKVFADWLESEALADKMADSAAQNAYYLRHAERPDRPENLMEAYRLTGAWDREVNASKTVLSTLASQLRKDTHNG